MNGLLGFQARHPTILRWAWLAFILALAACKQGDSSGGGGAY